MLRSALLGIVLVLVAGPVLAQTPAKDNKALCQQFYTEVVNKGNLDMIDQLMSEEFVDHEEFPGMEPGREGCKKFFAMMREAFPDLRFDVQFMLSEGDRVVAYITMSGTQQAEFMGIPASGKSFKTDSIDIIRIVDGKAVEHWGVTDALTMMQQLGASPEPEGN